MGEFTSPYRSACPLIDLPDAAIVNRGKPKLSYQLHRAVDGKSEIITATDAASGDVNEAHLMLPLLEKHEATTGTKANTIVADSKYGTIDNFLACNDKGIKAYIPDLMIQYWPYLWP